MNDQQPPTFWGDFQKTRDFLASFVFCMFLLILNFFMQWANMPAINAYNRHQFTRVAFLLQSTDENENLQPVTFRSMKESLKWLKDNDYHGWIQEEKYWHFSTTFRDHNMGMFSLNNQHWMDRGAVRKFPNGKEHRVIEVEVLYTENWLFKRYYHVSNGKWNYAQNVPKKRIEWLLNPKLPFPPYEDNPVMWAD